MFFLVDDWCSPGMLSWLSEATNLIALSLCGLCWWLGGDFPSVTTAARCCSYSLESTGEAVFTTESWKNLGLKVVLDFCNLVWQLSELVML